MKIDILSYPYDAEHFVVFFTRNGHDLGFKFAICEFLRDMDYLGFDCRAKSIDGKTGFIFHNSTEKEDIIFEAERFMKQYKL